MNRTVMEMDAHNTVYINGLTVLELVTRLEDWAVTNVIGGRSQVYPEREILVAALRKTVIREASVGSIAIRKDPIDGFPMIDGLEVTRGEDLYSWHHYDLVPKDAETVTERQNRILKDKRDYSFKWFMFGRMNRRKS